MVECSKIVTQSGGKNLDNQQVIDAVEQAVDQHQIFGDLLTTVEKQYLIREYEKALRAAPTIACQVGTCTACGVCKSSNQ